MKRVFMAVAALATSTLVAGFTPSPASAACKIPDGMTQYYTFSSVSTQWTGSNIYSDYLVGPGTITYSESKTATVSASMTATVSAEAGVVFAKASASLGVTVGASYSRSTTWQYQAKVASGKQGRLRMFHEMRNFVVKKSVWNPTTCRYVQRYSSSVRAPLKSNSNVWKIEYR